MRAERCDDSRCVAGGADDEVTGIEGGLGELDAHAAGGAGDEPDGASVDSHKDSFLDLTFEAMDLTSDPGLQLLAFSAALGSPSNDGLQLLATWAATAEGDLKSVDMPATRTADTS